MCFGTQTHVRASYSDCSSGTTGLQNAFSSVSDWDR